VTLAQQRALLDHVISIYEAEVRRLVHVPLISALTYKRFQDFLFDYGKDTDREQVYFRCPARRPRER
jgi:hypothetical protein